MKYTKIKILPNNYFLFQVIVLIEPNKNKDSKIYQDLEVELYKKTGKGLGLSVVGRRDGYGVFISDMVCITFSVKKC